MTMKYPLSNTFTFVAILGLIISIFYSMNGTLSPTWGFTLMLAFLIGTIASFVSLRPEDM